MMKGTSRHKHYQEKGSFTGEQAIMVVNAGLQTAPPNPVRATAPASVAAAAPEPVTSQPMVEPMRAVSPTGYSSPSYSPTSNGYYRHSPISNDSESLHLNFSDHEMAEDEVEAGDPLPLVGILGNGQVHVQHERQPEDEIGESPVGAVQEIYGPNGGVDIPAERLILDPFENVLIYIADQPDPLNKMEIGTYLSTKKLFVLHEPDENPVVGYKEKTQNGTVMHAVCDINHLLYRTDRLGMVISSNKKNAPSGPAYPFNKPDCPVWPKLVLCGVGKLVYINHELMGLWDLGLGAFILTAASDALQAFYYNEIKADQNRSFALVVQGKETAPILVDIRPIVRPNKRQQALPPPDASGKTIFTIPPRPAEPFAINRVYMTEDCRLMVNCKNGLYEYQLNAEHPEESFWRLHTVHPDGSNAEEFRIMFCGAKMVLTPKL